MTTEGTAVLALDLGTHTGFALGLAAVVVGTWNMKAGDDRYLEFQQKLAESYAATKFSQVYYERVRRHIGTDAAHVYGGLRGILLAFCKQHKIPYEGVPVGTIKKFWTGKGNAGKDLMIAEAEARGFEVDNDNEADALAILHWAMKERMSSPSIVPSVEQTAKVS